MRMRNYLCIGRYRRRTGSSTGRDCGSLRTVSVASCPSIRAERRTFVDYYLRFVKPSTYIVANIQSPTWTPSLLSHKVSESTRSATTVPLVVRTIMTTVSPSNHRNEPQNQWNIATVTPSDESSRVDWEEMYVSNYPPPPVLLFEASGGEFTSRPSRAN